MRFLVSIITKDLEKHNFICDRIIVNKTNIRFNIGLACYYFYKVNIRHLEIDNC